MEVDWDKRRDELEQHVSDAVAKLLNHTGATGLIARLADGRVLAIGKAEDIRESLTQASLMHDRAPTYRVILDAVILETKAGISDWH